MNDIPVMWTPDKQRQQIAEMFRNKGLICRDYFLNNSCPRSSSCSYMHIQDGETRRVPLTVCHFFTQRACLRDKCSFFHGTQAQLDQLRASGAKTYRPQDYMAIAAPPPEYLPAASSMAPQMFPVPIPLPFASALINPSTGNKVPTGSPILLLTSGVPGMPLYSPSAAIPPYHYGTAHMTPLPVAARTLHGAPHLTLYTNPLISS
ncbi:uncharacterized protein TM35_000041480 [Trypanosoma theileri]|uniref:C3H1-type domain-containing protein n=1 Tax=Trypanosoma theileri TaxID=67003 RepID=A0A1X0P4Q8_9TRYP|nr:uncharacterized protein TM35_000041480 [Trypanosoma theileri]ORC91934.1 hypothetical protein TM35_000041480 [Trypanosoma theileri]